MRITIEFVGGPRDGDTMVLPELMPDIKLICLAERPPFYADKEINPTAQITTYVARYIRQNRLSAQGFHIYQWENQ